MHRVLGNQDGKPKEAFFMLHVLSNQDGKPKEAFFMLQVFSNQDGKPKVCVSQAHVLHPHRP